MAFEISFRNPGENDFKFLGFQPRKNEFLNIFDRNI